jgi:hypothetical protein
MVGAERARLGLASVSVSVCGLEIGMVWYGQAAGRDDSPSYGMVAVEPSRADTCRRVAGREE